MAIEFTPFDATDHFQDEGSQRTLLEEAFESEDPNYILHALGVTAKAKGMSQIAHEAAVARKALYKSLAEGDNTKLSTFVSVVGALGSS